MVLELANNRFWRLLCFMEGAGSELEAWRLERNRSPCRSLVPLPWGVAGLSVAVCGQVVFGVMGSVASLTGSTCVLVIVLDAAQDS